VEFNVVEWQVLLNSARATPDSPSLQGAMALNVSSPSSDVGVMARYFSSANFPPNGFNFEQWKDDEFDAALKTIAEGTDPKAISAAYRKAHERLVDNPPGFLSSTTSIRRAMSVRRIRGFVSATVVVRRFDASSACNNTTRKARRAKVAPGGAIWASPSVFFVPPA